MKKTKIMIWIYNHSILIIALAASIYPIYWILQISLKSYIEAFKYPPSWFFKPNFENYQRLFVNSEFLHSFTNSFLVSSISTFLAISIGMPAAYVFSRLRFKFKNLVLLLVLTSRMIPPISFIVPYFMVYVKIGLIDTLTGLIVIYTAFSLGLVVWSMWTFLDEVPMELDEAARVDGASVLQTLWRVIMPVVTPGLASTGILCFLMNWNDFIIALVLTRMRAVTSTVVITKFMAYEAADIGLMTASAVIVSLPAVFFSVIMRKYLKKGMLSGAVKG